MTDMTDNLHFSVRIDCESTQPAVQDAALGRRASLAFGELLEAAGGLGSFFCIASEVKANADAYRDLAGRGHQVGLHVHPADLGYEEFLGIYGPDEQRAILSECTDAFAQVMGYRPPGVCLGYGSSNDYTRPILVELGYDHGQTQIPGRILPECASIAAGAPTEPHYAHPWNRVLAGNLDFVELPGTTDPDSRMWGGKHPQDLRIELVDAKNHYYTIRKAVRRQLDAEAPIKAILANTHNIFPYDVPHDFRRQTLHGVIEHTKRLAAEHDLVLVPATEQQIAAAYRAAVPLPAEGVKLDLDRRGHGT
jgi:peptidoglycan/xylan/chitin deacetylase (PgdA/CDA1 family)